MAKVATARRTAAVAVQVVAEHAARIHKLQAEAAITATARIDVAGRKPV